MGSQLSDWGDSMNIYFVIPKGLTSENDCSEDMWESLQKCEDNDMSPKWITEEKCLKLKPEKTDIFVIEKFEGEIFEKLQKFKCLILGPKCLLRCFLTNEPVPPGTSPVLNTAMTNNVICLSGFTPEEKASLQRTIEYMGGICTKQLRSCVTHLITDSVSSAKYEKAYEDKIQIYKKDWVKSVWDINLTEYVHANDERFNKHKVPPFMNLVVTSTNLTRAEKEEVKKLITKNGGEFMGPLDGLRVKVLIAKEFTTMSQKIKYAVANDIACLSIDWVRRSAETGYCLPYNEYLIKSPRSRQCSTPEKGSQATPANLNFSTISSISKDYQPNLIEETLSSTMANTMASTMASTISTNLTVNGHDKTPQYGAVVERLTIKEAKKAGPFLDGCNIYLSGFAAVHRDRVNKILNMGSATRYDDISETLTHVIVGDVSKAAADLKVIQAKGLHPHILNINWLEESIRLKKPAPEELFAFDKKEDPKKTEPPSPLSKRNLQMLQRPKKPPVPVFKLDKNGADDDEPDLVKQYLESTIPMANPTSNNSSPSEIGMDCTKKMGQSRGDESAVPLSQSTTMGTHIFKGLAFYVIGFDEEEGPLIRESITGLGGQLLPTKTAGIPDFAVVPFEGVSQKLTANEIVTSLFIDDCLDNDRLVDIEYYHRPICIPEHVKPLTDCVIVVSSYTGMERSYLSKLAIALGARHQDTFARRTNVEKGLYAGTHLICTSPTGNKYNAAVKWKLPAVTAEWLKACAAKLKLVGESPYLVGESIAPEREGTQEGSTQETLPGRPILTPKRYLNQTPNLETPIINKRLSLNKNSSGNSPFHFATPETPYGQVFQENPSPETRKAWAKWIDGLPEKSETQQAKKRRLSTPLSEIKRQLWSALKKPNNRQDDDNRTPTDAGAGANVGDDRGTPIEDRDNPPINRELSFNDDTPKRNEIHQELEQMDKMLKATSSSSNEGRFSIHGDDREKIVENCDVPATQVESVGWEDPHPPTLGDITDHQQIVEVEVHEKPRKLKFMLSGIKDRESYEQLIRALGGEVAMDSVFDETATHLLCVRPSRNEKMLSSIASGKWVLHCSYLRACEQAGQFIDEEAYEWGNPLSEGVIPVPEGESEKAMIAAAHRWRLKLKDSEKGAFQDMVAILLVNHDKYDMFERLIKAGGGIVVQAKHPYDATPTGKKITHCFITNRLGQPVDWAMLASKGILCFQPQYLNLLLTATEPINPRDHVLPDFKKWLALWPK